MATNNKAGQQVALAEHYFRTGQSPMAEALLEHVIASGAGTSKAYELLGYIKGNRGLLDSSQELLVKACQMPGASAEAFFYVGKIELGRGRPEAAIDCLKRSIKLGGEYFEALHELGVAHSELRQSRLALDYFKAAGRKRPGSPELHFNMGRCLDELHRFDDAILEYGQALRLNPKMADAWVNRGVTLAELGRGEEALASFERALELIPDDVPTLVNRATALNSLRRHEEALSSYERLVEIAPTTDYVYGNLLHTMMLVCKWDGWNRVVEEVLSRVDKGETVALPFALLATPASAGTLLRCAQTYSRDKFPAQSLDAPSRPREPDARIRIGYFSADFYDHATAQLMAGLFERHDRERFELFAFSFGRQVHDEMRSRLVQAFDHFLDVSDRGDQEVAESARSLGIDIAIDLKGYTSGARPNIFAHRAAPLQVNYLGFPGTMGCQFIDYVVADTSLIFENEFENYSEKVVLLPDSYQVNDDKKQISASCKSRTELGLPAEGFVFASFNNCFKITPDVFDVWMRILAAVPGSVLWLFKSNDSVVERLECEARRRGVDPERLRWAERMDLSSHLARHAQADLFLDTFYCDAHTTCSDSLWAGLPVLTMAGETFASRVSASLLRAVGLPELVTEDKTAYEAAALSLARSPQRLFELRDRLERNRATSPLFDTGLYARRFESALSTMWARHEARLPPERIVVPAGSEISNR